MYFQKQIEPLFTEITGIAFTVKLEIAVLEETQPTELLPVTEYDVLAMGFTVAEILENV